MTLDEAMTALRHGLIKQSGLDESAVSFEIPNHAENKNITLYAFGFPLQTLPKPLSKSAYVKVEYRENLKTTGRKQRELLKDAILLSRKMGTSFNGVQLSPYENGIEGRDEKIDSVYLVEWAWEITY